MNIYYLRVSEGQRFGSCSAGWSQLRVSYEVATETLASSSGDLTEAGGSASQRVCRHGAGCEENISVPATGSLPGLPPQPEAGCLWWTTTGQGAGRKRQCLPWPSFASHTPPRALDCLQ